MASVEDRWTRVDPDTGKRVRTERYGRGLRWRARWAAPDGRYPTRSFATKSAAQAHLEHVGVAKRTGEYLDTDRGRVTVGEYAASWLDAQGHLKPSGRARVEGIVDGHLRPRWGTVQLIDVEHEMVQAWVSALPGRPGGVRRIHGVLVSILDAAVKARRIPRNEARGVNLPRTVKREHRYLSVPELDALLARCDAWTAVVRALALTGMRVGELAELRVRDVDLRRRRATVTRSTTTVGGRRVTGTTKTDAGSRTVPLADEVVDDMRALVKGRHRDDLVYTTPHGAQLRRDNLRRAFLAAFARSGLEGTMTVHDLRHTAASLAVASGASVLAVQRMLGHATPAITLNVYADLFDQDLDHVLDRMRALIAERRAAAQRPDSAPDEAA